MLVKGDITLFREGHHLKASYGLVEDSYEALAVLDVLHNNEQAYFKSLKFKKRRHSYLLGRVSAKYAIQNLTGQGLKEISIEHGVIPFPVVTSSQNIQVSISHCANLGLSLAYPEAHPLAIDIETIHEDQQPALAQAVGQEDRALLLPLNLSEITGYTLIWTVKEALSKIIRTGLTANLNIMNLKSLIFHGDYFESKYVHFGQYKTFSKVYPGYVVSIALPFKTTVSLDTFWKDLALFLH